MFNLVGTRVLVTGAAGFIGANLVRELLGLGAEVHVLPRATSDLWRLADVLPHLAAHEVDLLDGESLRRVAERVCPEIVYHLAATSGHALDRGARLATLETSVLGTANLLEAVAAVGFRRFVHMGSSLEYGPRDRPLAECDYPEPSTFRGAAKAAATLLCQQFARANRQPVIILRPFSVYGYWEGASRLVPTVVRSVLGNREIALTEPGYRRDFVFVEDVVEACLLAAERDGLDGEIINVGSGRQWANEEVVELAQTIAGRRVPVHVGAYPPRPPDTTCWVADIGKARELLGWQPRHDLRDGLEKTISWFRRYGDVYEAREHGRK